MEPQPVTIIDVRFLEHRGRLVCVKKRSDGVIELHQRRPDAKPRTGTH